MMISFQAKMVFRLIRIKGRLTLKFLASFLPSYVPNKKYALKTTICILNFICSNSKYHKNVTFSAFCHFSHDKIDKKFLLFGKTSD